MAWLLGPMFASFIASIFVTKVLELMIGGMTGMAISIIKPVVFVGTWATVSTQTMMRSFTRTARRVRRVNASMIKAVTHSK